MRWKENDGDRKKPIKLEYRNEYQMSTPIMFCVEFCARTKFNFPKLKRAPNVYTWMCICTVYNKSVVKLYSEISSAAHHTLQSEKNYAYAYSMATHVCTSCTLCIVSTSIDLIVVIVCLCGIAGSIPTNRAVY